MFGVFLELRGKRVVVIGGGPVGRRKARAAMAAGARVLVVSLDETPRDLEVGIEWAQEPYRPEHLDGTALVFAATNSPTLNAEIANDARVRGIWVNLADAPSEGDFHVPALLRHGDFVIAVSTGGAAPSVAATVRDRLAQEYDAAWGEWVALLAEMRQECKGSPQKRELLTKLADVNWVERIRSEGMEAVRVAMRGVLHTVGE
jgi:precorrin-2 dehydrogenase/sirohydrochlorin ferrochelatase